MNAQDDSAVGRLWAQALGWGVSSEEPGVTNVEPAGFSYPHPVAVCIDVLAVPEPKMRPWNWLSTRSSSRPPLRPIRRTSSRCHNRNPVCTFEVNR
jgi:hypothetical protein